MPLPIDYKLTKIFNQIKVEIKDELGIDISLQVIESVINQQINSTIHGMERGDTIAWKYFGKFTATQKRVDMLNKTYEKKGKVPTLRDTGYIRVALNRKGQIINEDIYEPDSKKDLIPDFILKEIENGK